MGRQAIVPVPSTNRPVGRRSALAVIASALGASALGGCAVGPDYTQPDLPAAASVSAGPLPARTAGQGEGAAASQAFLAGRDLPHDWWTLFGSAQLTALVAQALKANPDLEAAQATLRQTQENALAARGGMFPSLGIKASGTRVGFSAASIGQSYSEVFTLNTSQLSISYPLDIFGGTRRQGCDSTLWGVL